MLYFLKDLWKFIEIHQYYTMALKLHYISHSIIFSLISGFMEVCEPEESLPTQAVVCSAPWGAWPRLHHLPLPLTPTQSLTPRSQRSRGQILPGVL